ncbi:DNA cytosine methyltransferase [Fusobacterium nucleatum]|uniref:DNA cytosine methyltransferase n=1 Tax=Fusobacterium nucleatum TaxID=851 RepID=UPI00309DD44F
MKIKYEGKKFLNFIEELKEVNIPEVSITFIEDSVYYKLPGDFLYISEFHSAPTRRGFGSKAMQKIVILADKYKINLFLFPYGTSEKFYSKFGFEEKSDKYTDFFEPLKLFRFYSHYEKEFKNFFKNKYLLKNFLNNLKKTFPMEKKIIAVDLFCGIGGLTYGLEKTGIKVIAGIDLDKSCKFAYEKNNNVEFIYKNITELKGIEILPFYEKADIKVLVGCAPCQPFSEHQKDKFNRKKHKDWGLLYEFLRLIKEVDPDIISMENVPNLRKEEVFNDFLFELKRQGYFINYTIKNALECGVPQKRKRLLLLASKFGKINFLEKNEKIITVKEAIGSLEKIEAGTKINLKDYIHISSSLTPINLLRIKHSLPGGTWEDWPKTLLPNCYKKDSGKTYKSVYGRMEWEKPSPTLTTQFYSFGTGRYGHPSQNRALSLREGAILQSFPEDYIFTEVPKFKFTDIARHIGNAVPPKLAEYIGLSILKHLEELNLYV